jgi:hypothetical protein
MVVVRLLIVLVTSPYWLGMSLLLALSGALGFVFTGRRVRLTLEERE